MTVSLLYDGRGNRKYLTIAERKAFLEAASIFPPKERLFCFLLAYSGARISEILYLTPDRFDLEARIVIIECLKKRRSGVFRAVPLPSFLLNEIESALSHRSSSRAAVGEGESLWGFGRTTGWALVKEAMSIAGIAGPPASPKGLRHAFAVAALQTGVPINMVRKWLGHSRIETTAIYADAVGDEEHTIATRLWKTF